MENFHPTSPRIIIIIIIIPYEFFNPAVADGLSLESEWQQAPSSLPDSSQYSGIIIIIIIIIYWF